MDGRPNCFEAVLPAELDSVVASRRLLGRAMDAWGLGDPARGDAALAVSELVSNSVLHAGTVTSVRVRRLGSGVRIEVEDGNPSLPVVDVARPEDLLANRSMTGRGLALVAATSDRWGADPVPVGKVVWAEVGTGSRRVVAAPPPAYPPALTASPPPLAAIVGETAQGVVAQAAVTGGGRVVHLVGVPVNLLLESSRQLWDLQREMQVIAMDRGAPEDLEPVVQAGRPWMADLDVWVDRDRKRLERVAASGAGTYDYDVEVPSDVIDRIAGVTAWIRRVTSTAVGRYLLTLPASNEVSALRRWIMDEIASQLSGANPRPCPIKDPVEAG